jgi:hypothetical protein
MTNSSGLEDKLTAEKTEVTRSCPKKANIA